MVLERLKEYIDSQGITVAAFEKEAGLSNASFRKTLQSGKGIGSDKLEKILTIYPDLSAEWLLRGEGLMLNSEREREAGFSDSERKLVEICKNLVGIYEQKDAAMGELVEIVKRIEK